MIGVIQELPKNQGEGLACQNTVASHLSSAKLKSLHT